MLIALLSASLILSLTGLFYSVKRNLEMMDKLEDLSGSLEGVVKILEDQHEKIDSKTKIEVFSDEPIIRELVQDIATARDAVKKSTSILEDVVTSLQEEDEETDDVKET